MANEHMGNVHIEALNRAYQNLDPVPQVNEIVIIGGSRSSKTVSESALEPLQRNFLEMSPDEQLVFYRWIHDTFSHCRIYK